MGLGIFIQVRLGSTRLAGKALLPLPGGSVIQHVMRSLAAVPAEVHALVTEPRSAEALAPLARAEGYGIFVGPEEDVLARYCMAARAHAVDQVIRATGDNPLTSPALARSIIAIHRETGADLSHYLGIPVGTGVEVIRSEALFTAEREAVDPAEREHCTTFLYRRPERFRIREEEPPPDCRFADARVTIDTPEDYERVARIFADLYRGEPLEVAEVAGWFAEASR